jgi:hypothetical protein
LPSAVSILAFSAVFPPRTPVILNIVFMSISEDKYSLDLDEMWSSVLCGSEAGGHPAGLG